MPQLSTIINSSTRIMKSLINIPTAIAVIMAFANTSCTDSKEESVVRPTIPTDPEVVAEVGKTMPGWREGYFEMHSISTGRGESFFYIFPDGTSMLVDAGGSLVTQEICEAKNAGGVTPARPSKDVSNTKVITSYILNFNPRGANVDYWINSHFDEDHMGSWTEKYDEYKDFPKHSEGKFYMNGIAEIGTIITFDKIIDRGYTLPINRGTEDRFKDYQRFLKWTMDTRGTVYEAANVGHTDQIKMNYNPEKFPGFKVRVLCASGYAWTGQGMEKKRTVPVMRDEITKGSPEENIYSVGLQLDYGNFNLYTAGDLQFEHRAGYEWVDGEAQIVPVMSEVEVMKASHHGSSNANGQALLEKLKPSVVLVSPWRTEQPGAPAVQRMVSLNPDTDIFCTNIDEGSKAPLAPFNSNFKSWNGHVVVRVYPDGKYMVYVLDDNDLNYTVKAIHGPYTSK